MNFNYKTSKNSLKFGRFFYILINQILLKPQQFVILAILDKIKIIKKHTQHFLENHKLSMDFYCVCFYVSNQINITLQVRSLRSNLFFILRIKIIDFRQVFIGIHPVAVLVSITRSLIA